jgi:rSAM/selenodomain-associated transferase 2
MTRVMTTPSLSVVIPLLDAATSLPATLAALDEGRAGGLVGEIVVADGGSRDGGGALAESLGARVIDAPRGRGPQLAAGAAAASGDWLLFLHADTRLAPGWSAVAARFMQEAENGGRAGVFRLALDDADPRARRIERLANWRTRVLGLPYGDQGLLLSRALYEALGGFRPLLLMEDVELARRIGRRRLVMLEGEALTSAARYRRDGWLRRPLRNLALLTAYFLGVPPHLLQRLYR